MVDVVERDRERQLVLSLLAVVGVPQKSRLKKNQEMKQEKEIRQLTQRALTDLKTLSGYMIKYFAILSHKIRLSTKFRLFRIEGF